MVLLSCFEYPCMGVSFSPLPLLEVFPGNCGLIWISWTGIIRGNNCQSPWLALLLVGKTCSGACILTDSHCTGLCVHCLLHAPRFDATTILAPIYSLFIVTGTRLWGWWVGATVLWLVCVLMWEQACFCDTPGNTPCQTLLGTQRWKFWCVDKGCVRQSRYNLWFSHNTWFT